jgi:hypothetical protein
MEFDIPKQATALSKIENSFEGVSGRHDIKCAKTYHGNCDEAVFIAGGTSLQANGKTQCTDDECEYNETDGDTLDERNSAVMLLCSADGKIRPESCVLS